MTAVRRLRPGDAAGFAAMLDLFAEAFDDPVSFNAARPGDAYRDALLADAGFVALVAEQDGTVGAIAAYELKKFERERSEFYIYDLAVAAPFRRQGIATALIAAVRAIAAERNAEVVFVQADYGDDPAVALYTKLGTREDVMHFDIPV